MLEPNDAPCASTHSYGHLTLHTDEAGAEYVLYLGYSLLLSKSERMILKAIFFSLPEAPSTAGIAEATGVPANQISVLVNRINRKASVIGGRKLIVGTSHHGFRLYEYM